MIDEIKKLNDSVFKFLNLSISEIYPDLESEDYLGFNFKLNEISIKFRKSKLTLKKVGQFVTLWKRDSDKKTIPFNINDNFDFYIIYVEEKDNDGFFLFPKAILQNNHILSTHSKDGKRGFRIYTDWHFPNNKQAEKSKLWQTDFFINNSDSTDLIFDKFRKITKIE